LVNQKILVKMLTLMGYNSKLDIDLVDDGESAVEAVKYSLECNSAYTIVLMDVNMPRLTGDEATKRIRVLTPTRVARDLTTNESAIKAQNIYIVALTANAMSGDREYCLSVGMNSYLAKPIVIATLAAVLKVAHATR
jgi:CheY-like chemotaxis protein